MSIDAEQVLRSALALQPNERAELAATLIASLDPPVQEDVNSAWALEIKRRLAEIDNGAVDLIPSDEILQSMRERLNG